MVNVLSLFAFKLSKFSISSISKSSICNNISKSAISSPVWLFFNLISNRITELGFAIFVMSSAYCKFLLDNPSTFTSTSVINKMPPEVIFPNSLVAKAKGDKKIIKNIRREITVTSDQLDFLY